MSVKIELANEHKEFVSGKKNGKINKIMGQSEYFQESTYGGCANSHTGSVQIIFDGFNEYNFYIVVRGAQYEATKNGLGSRRTRDAGCYFFPRARPVS